MPNWKVILDELKATGGAADVVNKLTGRNIIAYYSGWLQKTGPQRQGIPFEVNDSDKNGFMTAIHKLDKAKGLDLVLHTPGGSTGATESLVGYLRSIFGTNIRAIVPQLAMSAGTMIALSCREIVMGKHSSLGPIDPQVNGMPAHAIIEEFERAKAEITANPPSMAVWQPIIAKYPPTLISAAEKSILWCEQIVKAWLMSGMFHQLPDAEAKADKIIAELGSHAMTKAHDRHISIEKADSIGVTVVPLESHPALQDAVLSVHHTFVQTFSSSPAFKIIENHKGVAFVQQSSMVLIGEP
jgi:hypothetical protein